MSIKTLSKKYNRQIPRYTSYPTAVELKEAENSDEINLIYQKALNRYHSSSIYIHLPFCPKLCYFCACNKQVTQDYQKVRNYLNWLEKEIKQVAELNQRNSRIVQVHLGGGSPSYLHTEELQKLESLLNENFNLEANCQKSIEVDPRTFSSEKAATLIKHGYQRFSIGVQDFNPKVQKLINRIQPYHLTAETINGLRSASKKIKINLDLIYGLPGQDLKSFDQTVDQLIALRPERIALYAYAHVDWKVKVQKVLNKYGLPDSQLRLDLMSLAIKKLKEAGYLFIGMDHFALPDDDLAIALQQKKLKRNFMGYTTSGGGCQLAFGVSAISDFNDFILQNTTSLQTYKEQLEQNKLPVAKSLHRSDEDQLRSLIIESLMCEREFDFQELLNFMPDKLVLNILNQVKPKLKKFVEDKLIDFQNGKITVLEPGCFFLRNIAAVFDSYLDSGKGNFSKAL